MNVDVMAGILLPFAGTCLGAVCVFCLKEALPYKLQRAMLGFAAGVMVAASVWSLLLPALEMEGELGKLAVLPAAAGMAAGTLFLYGIGKLSAFHGKDQHKLILAVTLHNVPEGMAVGVALAGALHSGEAVTMAGALTLAAGIAIQNIPEGAIVSVPLQGMGAGRGKAAWAGVLSGLVEPLGSIAAIVLWHIVECILPVMLGFAAGSMLFVSAGELLPQAAGSCQENGQGDSIGSVGFFAGFLIMMALDVMC